MRILHILDHSLPLHSGYAFRSDNIFRAQAKRGWQLAVLTSPKHQKSWKGEWKMLEMMGEIPHFRTKQSGRSWIPGGNEAYLISALNRRLREVCTTAAPDIIHAHSPVLDAIPALRVGRRRGIPVVYEIRAFWEDAAVDHGTYSETSWKYHVTRSLETHICRRANHVVVICDGLRQDLIARGIPADKISIVRNGISLEDFNECPPDDSFVKEWRLAGRRVVAFMGSFYKYEGLDLLVSAFKMVLDELKNCVLLLAGGGETEESLKRQVKQLGLEDSVLMPGRIAHERIPCVYALAEILVYPRYSMRLTNLVTPLKPLEAMAMGKAVVASDVGGHMELIRNRETGLLFRAGDVGELAACIKGLLKDPKTRESLAEKGRDWVRRERPWEKTTAVYDEIYRMTLNKR
jgi:PEP-CTERM/exosortase A-associated glycosyltransferase